MVRTKTVTAETGIDTRYGKDVDSIGLCNQYNEHFQKPRTHNLDFFLSEPWIRILEVEVSFYSVYSFYQAPQLWREEISPRMKNTFECKTITRSRPFCLSVHYIFQFFKNCSSSEGDHKRMKTLDEILTI